jgi:CRISPR-associated protein Cmr1
MHSITFDCELITPLFMGSANPNDCELRAPSIKGALRFWWRAINGHLPLNELHEKEEAIFGSTSGRSNIVIRIQEFLKQTNEYPMLPHKQGRESLIREGFQVKEKFRIKFQMSQLSIYSKSNPYEEIFSLEKLKALFIIFSLLGGLGKRNRRGFGSIKIKKINQNDFQYPERLEDMLILVNSLSNNFQLNNTNNSISILKEKHEKFPYVKEIILGKKGDLASFLLEDIGEQSHLNDSFYTGFAEKIQIKSDKKPKTKRFSSPVYASIYKNTLDLQIILTTFNTAFEDYVQTWLKENPNNKNSYDRSRSFKKALV